MIGYDHLRKDIFFYWTFLIVLLVVGFCVMPQELFSTRVHAANLLPADANSDCVVDEKDYAVWLNNYLHATTAGVLVGDFNTSGVVDGVDYVIWLKNYYQRCPATTPTNTPTQFPIPTSTPFPTVVVHVATPTPTQFHASPTPWPTNTSGGSVQYQQLKTQVEAYKATHPGNGGKDWDINAKTSAQIAADPAAQQLLTVCGLNQRPVFPSIAWEYGGNDHQWINPNASALVYCVYIPVNSQSSHWAYNSGTGRVTSDVYVLFPDQNPCKNMSGKDQVLACLGDPTNSEILVDTASLNDGHGAGYELAEASTALVLILPDGTKVQLLLNI